jgi:hypothetical protein
LARKRSHGEGTIFQDSLGYWVAEVTLPDGRRKRKYSNNQKLVKEWLMVQRKALQDGIWVKDDKVTLSEFFDQFLNDTLAHKLKPKTINSSAYLFNPHVTPTLGDLKLIDLRSQHLQALYAQKIYIKRLCTRNTNNSTKFETFAVNSLSST